jgi:hypothetical protein
MKTFARLYAFWVVAVLLAYGWAGLSGCRMRDAPTERIDPSVRSSPGGFRSHYFWHSGFFGGK